METWDFPEESVVVVAETVGDFVEDGKLGTSQQTGLPQGEDGAAELIGNFCVFLLGQISAVALFEEIGDRHLAGYGALATHFRRVCGQNRADQCAVEEAMQLPRSNVCGDHASDCVGERAGARRGASPQVSPV